MIIVPGQPGKDLCDRTLGVILDGLRFAPGR